jgi:hypothetical protein
MPFSSLFQRKAPAQPLFAIPSTPTPTPTPAATVPAQQPDKLTPIQALKIATRALETYLQALESASHDAQSASRAPVSSLLSGKPKFTYFTSYRLTTELQYARDKLALSDIPPLPKHHPTDRQINAHRLLEHSKSEIDGKLSELANLRGDESDESATEVDDDTLMQMLRKAILVVDDLRHITDLFQEYRDALGRKEEEKSERHKENLETLQTVSGAITGIVGAINPR